LADIAVYGNNHFINDNQFLYFLHTFYDIFDKEVYGLLVC